MHRAHARMVQGARRIQQHITFVVGHREAERHDQGAAFQLIIEQGASRNRYAHAGDGGFDGQVVAVEGVATAYIGDVIADGIQVELPLRILITPTPGGNVMQQRKMQEIGRPVQGRSPRNRLGAQTGKICSSSRAVDNRPG